jgi:pyruvate kinase
MKKKEIICTIGPSTYNNKKLNYLKKKVSLFRINLSHTKVSELKKKILFLKKIIDIKKICIDTEGAQIRTGLVNSKVLKKNQVITFGFDKNCQYPLYPEFKISKIKTNIQVLVGFDNLKLKVISLKNKKIYCRVVSSGKIESNKGVHINADIKLPCLTKKDLNCIKIAQSLGVKNYALSFANKKEDVNYLRNLILKKHKIISKIETLNAIKNLHEITSKSDAILIDRGDLSRYIKVQDIPKVQEYIIKKAKKLNTKVYVATNLVESMVTNPSPTRAESNDIYQSLLSGASGLVLAAETAIGKYPLEVIKFIDQCIKSFNKKNLNLKKIKLIIN